MFFVGARFLLALAGIVLGIFVLSQFKITVLALSWAIILFCMWILYVKSYRKGSDIDRRLDESFVKFKDSKFFRFVIDTAGKFEGKKRGRK